MAQLILKATFGEETHRVSLNAPFTFAAVRSSIANFFPQLASFRINYRDEDGDCITVATDTDIAEAVRFFGKQPVKFTIVADNKPAANIAAPAAAQAPAAVPAPAPAPAPAAPTTESIPMVPTKPRSPDAPVYSVAGFSIGGTPAAQPTPVVAAAPAVRYQARFVRDISVPDGTCFAPQAAFRKTWLIRNAGECAWPADCVLRFEAGDQLNGVATSVPAAQPNQDVELSVDFRCPNKEGKFVSYWRLCNSEGIVFGDRIWSEIRVEKPTVVSAPAPVVVPAAPAVVAPTTPAPAVVPPTFSAPVPAPFVFSAPSFAYQPALDQLKSMGFADNDRTRRVLIRYRGDVNRTAQDLLDT